MVVVIFGVWYGPDVGWVFTFNPSDAEIAASSLRPIGWPWYTAIGAGVNLTVGSLLALRHRTLQPSAQ